MGHTVSLQEIPVPRLQSANDEPFGWLKIWPNLALLCPRESRVRPNPGSGCEPERLHLIGVLSFADEFREDVGGGGIQEEFRHALAQGIGHDQL